jgi:hypothetical protein
MVKKSITYSNKVNYVALTELFTLLVFDAGSSGISGATRGHAL